MRFRRPIELLYKREEPGDPRLGEIAQMPEIPAFEKASWDLAIVGLPDDRGVLQNRGRPGAAEGPDAIRKWFYRLVPKTLDVKIADLGNLEMPGSLEASHALATDAVAVALGRARRVVVLGGGHDWAYSSIAALLQGGRTGFVNFDAHLDVRASPDQHSGTSFWRALETGVAGEDAIWCGVQNASAAVLHLEYVGAKGGRIFFSDEEPASFALPKCEGVEISLDMDVFTMSEAPGVSAPQPAGVSHERMLPWLREALSLPNARTFGIYELSPPNDVAEATARLAARCLWEAL